MFAFINGITNYGIIAVHKDDIHLKNKYIEIVENKYDKNEIPIIVKIIDYCDDENTPNKNQGSKNKNKYTAQTFYGKDISFDKLKNKIPEIVYYRIKCERNF